ncbi:hypothetical protein [Kribbella solani]|uniref:Uncharacterized protein n=1 Tax=Kribbella solani TaxID=236067 RepID=A0A841DUF2_9ACTN|nr:hypothetical protein [Kribbella solani]MBB5982233.1 hypothetical protein [Kribbella solani]MDX2968531.1 hypothetical protein [Kribbella solani]MDX3003890.1 hypothetical protein [Kribbella solani]
MKRRALLAVVVAVPLALGLAACDHQPTGYRPSAPTDAPTVSKTVK